MRRIPFLVVALTLASGAHADTVDYLIIGPTGYTDCTFQETGAYTVVASLNLTEPAKSLQFSAPMWCGGPGFTWFQTASGDVNSMVTLDFGGCVLGSLTLYTAQFNVDHCCPALMQGPQAGGETTPPILIGCDDTPRYVIPPCSTGEPMLTTPPDGATTSVTPLMSWTHSIGDYCAGLIGLTIFTVHYGTDPANLDQTYSANETPQLTLPTLAPGTQYFWQVSVWDDYAAYTGTRNNVSEIRSFTTNAAVSVEALRWSAVKVRYR